VPPPSQLPLFFVGGAVTPAFSLPWLTGFVRDQYQMVNMYEPKSKTNPAGPAEPARFTQQQLATYKEVPSCPHWLERERDVVAKDSIARGVHVDMPLLVGHGSNP